MVEKFRKTGINIIGDVPYGAHFCQFYQTREDLIDILVPYFKAGLENNEFCMWVAQEPLSEEEAKEAMRKALPDFDQYLKRGQIEIVPHTKWYLKDGVFNLQRVLNAWIDKLHQALSKGYDGIRATGNIAWLEKRDWKSFADYEKKVNNIIGKYRMIALCTYCLEKCGASQIIEVVNNHQFVLIRREGKWALIESSERKRMEEALVESEKKYRDLVNNALVGIYKTNLKGDILYVNEALWRMLEFESPEEMVGESALTRYKNPKDREGILENLGERGRIEDFDTTLLTKTGKTKDILLSATLNGDTISGMIMDITERKRAEEALQESKELFEKIFITQQDAIFLLDSATPSKIIDCNPGVTKIFGYTRQEIIGRTSDILHVDDTSLKEFREYLYSAIAERGFLHLNEFRMRRKDRTVFPTEHSVMPLEDEQGKHIGWVSVVRDITERKQAEEEREYLFKQVRISQEQLQSLSRRLIEVQEADRRFLASELHDQVGQNLTALSINLNIIRSQFSEEVDKKIVDRLKDSLKLVEETIERMRNVMAGLRPPVLDDYGLGVALRWYTERFSERTGVATILQEEELFPRLPLVVETALFRIVQEVLTNVAKHAKAREVLIKLEKVDGKIQLAISDNGVGFDPAALRQLKEQPRLGLITIEERAKALAGDVYVKSALGKGTQVVVQLPC
jgi:PAS domain S-box-containing protein